MKTIRYLPVLWIGLCVGLPLTSFCEHKIPIRRNLEGSRGFHHYGYQPCFYRPSSFAYRIYESPRVTGPITYSFPKDYPTDVCACRGSGASHELALDIQQALHRSGYYRGFIDGLIGPRTRDAIRACQADLGLPQTGRVDSRLLQALGIV